MTKKTKETERKSFLLTHKAIIATLIVLIAGFVGIKLSQEQAEVIVEEVDDVVEVIDDTIQNEVLLEEDTLVVDEGVEK